MPDDGLIWQVWAGEGLVNIDPPRPPAYGLPTGPKGHPAYGHAMGPKYTLYTMWDSVDYPQGPGTV